jgi:LmbE family N-acetylglucosaminyl deacetylase
MTDALDPRTAATLALSRAQQLWLRHYVHRRVVDLPPAKRALVLAPHADDEVIGCGGTLVKLAARGVPTRIAYLTDGRAVSADTQQDEAMAATRAAEARSVSARLGLSEPILVGWNERTFSAPANEAALVERLAGVLASVEPDAVYVPFFQDAHGDHRYANHLLARALVASGREPTIYAYEVWSLVPPGLVVDISAELEEKQRLIDCYPSQLAYLDYHALVDALAKLHAPLLAGANACEAFCPFGARAYVEAAGTLDLASPASMETVVLLTRPESMPA